MFPHFLNFQAIWSCQYKIHTHNTVYILNKVPIHTGSVLRTQSSYHFRHIHKAFVFLWNPVFSRHIPLHSHMQVILFPKFCNPLHHQRSMVPVKRLLISPAVNQQYRLRVCHWKEILIPQISLFPADVLYSPAGFHFFCKLSRIAVCSGIINIHNDAHTRFPPSVLFLSKSYHIPVHFIDRMVICSTCFRVKQHKSHNVNFTHMLFTELPYCPDCRNCGSVYRISIHPC